MGLSWFMRYTLHNSYIHWLQLWKYNLTWDFSRNGQISINEWKKKFKMCRISTFPEPIFCRNIYDKYVDVLLKIEKPLTERSLVYTALILAGNQTEVACSGMIPLDHQDLCTVNTVWMSRYQTAYIIQMKAFHWIIE